MRGLTTAATVWLTCAVGMACGGGLPILAVATTALHFVVVRGYPRLPGRLSPGSAPAAVEVRLTYLTGRALLPRLLEVCTRLGFRILQVRVEQPPRRTEQLAQVLLRLEGTAETGHLASELFHHDGVVDVDLFLERDERLDE